MSERTPPTDRAAEQATLGAILLSATAADDIFEQLTADDFADLRHSNIYTAAATLHTRGAPIDAVTICAELTKNGTLARIGGPAYIHTLLETVPTAASGVYYAQRIKDLSGLRRIIEAGTRITQLGYQGEGEPVEIADQAETELLKATETATSTSSHTLSELLDETISNVEAAARGERPTGITSGYPDLDKYIGGFKPGQLIVIAARPAVGKSTVALDLARNAAIGAGIPTAFYTLEMSRTEVVERLLAAETNIPLTRLTKGDLSEPEWLRLAQTRERIDPAPLFIEDSSSLTLMEIRSRSRRLTTRHNLGLIVVDYLQLLNTGTRRAETRQEEVAQMSRSLKLLAKELHVPVIALSQLNRGPDQRQDKRPVASDIRESGAVEQDSDIIILLHRDELTNPDSTRVGEIDLILAKHRNGPTGTVQLLFKGHVAKLATINPHNT